MIRRLPTEHHYEWECDLCGVSGSGIEANPLIDALPSDWKQFPLMGFDRLNWHDRYLWSDADIICPSCWSALRAGIAETVATLRGKAIAIRAD